mgnify:FL=1
MTIDTAYLCLTDDVLDVERKQAIEEGKPFERVAEEFETVRELVGQDPHKHQDRAGTLLDAVEDLPVRDSYSYHEPADLDAIRESRPDGPRMVRPPTGDVYDHVLVGWLGRCAGCLLGKPVEGWMVERIHGLLKDLGMYPLRQYVPSQMPESVWRKFRLDEVAEHHLAFADEVDHMVRDDDLDFTIANLDILRGDVEFDSEDVVSYWLSNFPLYKMFTAERVAYRNFSNFVLPPESATRRNPYREGIGAQIRADIFGYTHLGSPEAAAELAWRDARISHVKNGIYGEMWVAAMLAAAPGLDDREGVIRTGLSEIPAESRLTEAVEDVIGWYHDDVSYDGAVGRIHDRWDENSMYGWLHTISNAQIVAVGLLWGEGDFEQSIGRAVQVGFDTDCNGATVGSIIGMMHGADSLPSKWVDPLNDTVETSLVDYPLENISELSRKTVELHEKHI